MQFAKQVLILGSFVFVMGFGNTGNRAFAEESAPAKVAAETKGETNKKGEHCDRCHDKHAKGAKDCQGKCEHCKEHAATECEHCKGQKDCAKCHDKEKAAKKSDRSAASFARATFIAV